jgi:hypothetical protein
VAAADFDPLGSLRNLAQHDYIVRHCFRYAAPRSAFSYADYPPTGSAALHAFSAASALFRRLRRCCMVSGRYAELLSAEVLGGVYRASRSAIRLSYA